MVFVKELELVALLVGVILGLYETGEVDVEQQQYQEREHVEVDGVMQETDHTDRNVKEAVVFARITFLTQRNHKVDLLQFLFERRIGIAEDYRIQLGYAREDDVIHEHRESVTLLGHNQHTHELYGEVNYKLEHGHHLGLEEGVELLAVLLNVDQLVNRAVNVDVVRHVDQDCAETLTQHNNVHTTRCFGQLLLGLRLCRIDKD